MKKIIGIWIDLKSADLISIENNEATTWTIPSEVETNRARGGSYSSPKWGPHDIVDEKKFLLRKNLQLKKYYEEITKACSDKEHVYIFGPAETKYGLQNHMVGLNEFKPLIVGVESADQMTIKQKIAKVREMYEKI